MGNSRSSLRRDAPSTAVQQQQVQEESGSLRPHPSRNMNVQRCRRQHDVLATYIGHFLEYSGPLNELPLSYWSDGTGSARKGSSLMQETPELKRVLTRVKILSQDCCRELPPMNAVLHNELSETFADIMKEIQWYLSLVPHGSTRKDVKNASASQLIDCPWQADIRLSQYEVSLLKTAEKEDRQELEKKRNIWKQNHNCSAEVCGNMHRQKSTREKYCLSKQAKPQSTGEGYKSKLWSFDRGAVHSVRPLGSGSFGRVEEVTWLGLNYAHKIFDDDGVQHLQAEADALVMMRHPHIVRVLAYSQDSLLMDLMCEDLRKCMRRRMTGGAGLGEVLLECMRRLMKGGARVQPFSLQAAIDLMLQIADACCYFHSRGMVHRDLKPSNILVKPLNVSGGAEDDEFVFAKIADFGLAKEKQEITRYSQLTHNVGTKKWMAPEIFGANIDDDHPPDAFPMKADVYSFGIVCSEILSGKEPFKNVRPGDLYSRLTAQDPLRPRLPSRCPPSLASLVRACWDTDPQKRPVFSDVCQRLRNLKGHLTLTDMYGPVQGKWSLTRMNAMFQGSNSLKRGRLCT